ncbi:hypothetical protein LTR66_004589 [Elasticomyces elasticus]|nr:hypothetical protein LTR66_004589 [Elasticomyces elasticus]KAK5007940.1 hypothetical protein LTR28_004646 [Elasticomyces elasticus]
MPALLPIFKKAYWTLGALVTGYVTVLLLLTSPWLQRHALYSHKLHSGFYHNVNNPESFGFAPKQVTPFNISIPDGETLYAWHVLPLNVYARHNKDLLEQDTSLEAAVHITSSKAFRLLTKDPDAKIVINFHGNAGHVAQGWRTDTYRSLTGIPNTHVFTIDYRGFGFSTGSPTEAGLITDGVALANWVIDVAGIPPDRIVILGQSLGTAVASAVALRFADPASDLLPIQSTGAAEVKKSIVFAGVVLVAPFTSLPSLLLTYRIGGLVPVLAPLRPYPYLLRLFTSKIVDTWRSADRLAAYMNVLTDSPLCTGKGGAELGGIQIIHALNDQDISFRQGEMLFATATNTSLGTSAGFGERVSKKMNVKIEGKPRIRLDVVEHGGE